MKNRKIIQTVEIFSIFILCFALSFPQKQNLEFSHLTSENGLAANSVYTILQDHEGFLWFGTYNGLNKYDGYKFIIYQNIEGDSTSISENKIRTMIEDNDGNLWIGTWYMGLNKFDRSTNKFRRFLHDENNSNSISSNSIISIFQDKEGFIWIGTEGAGLNKFDKENEKFYHFINQENNPSSLSDNIIYSLYEDNKGILWIGTGGGGLNKLDKASESFISFLNHPENPKSISSNWVMSIIEDRSGILYVGTVGGGLNIFDQRQNEFIHYSNDKNQSNCSNNIWSMFEDSEGTIWIGTNDAGISTFNSRSGELNCSESDFSDPLGLNDYTINSIYEDKSGILWFGTWNGGLNKYNKYEKKFKTIEYDPGDSNSLSANSIFSIYLDSFGDLWVGTDVSGLNRMKKNTNKFIHYTNNPNDPYSISNDCIYSLCEDRNGNIWIGTDNGGINKFNRTENKFTHFRHNPDDTNSIQSDRISQIFFDSKENLWIGEATGGFDKLSESGNNLTHYSPDRDNYSSLSKDMVWDFNEDNSGNLWIGTHGGGLYKFNIESEKFTKFENDPKNSSSLSSNSISVIHIDNSGTIWVGTDGAGLNKFDSSTKSFKRFKEIDGLPNDVICGILEDGKGNLWISTYKGISKFDPHTERFRNFGAENGLQGLEFNNWAYFKDNSGWMYFGGTNGLNVFHPDSLIDNLFIPPIVITDFQILHKPVSIGYDSLWGRTILERSISETEFLELNYDDNIISFEFAALDFRNPERNQYAYFLEGFDKGWISTDAKKRYVTYTNLDPGEYVFRVRGSNNDGVWNEAGTSLNIKIIPPWWATWWSYILYGFISVLLFGGVTRFYLNRERLRTQLDLEHDHAKKLEEVDKMKSNFYANISHEFRTPLMLILGPLEKLSTRFADDESTKQAGLIRGNAKRLLNLINQLLDLSKLEAKKLKLNAVKGNISQFARGIVNEFESIADQKDISLKIIYEKEIIEAYFDKEKMEKIITNVMSNALKFTPQSGRITIKIAETLQGEVEITVRDSGIGIPKIELPKIFDRFYQVDGSHTREHEGTGIGLALAKEFVELHRGHIIVDSVEGHWTEVKIYFPPGHAHLSEGETTIPDDFETHKILSIENLNGNGLGIEDNEIENLEDKTIVLVVEDNPDLREYIKDDLKKIYHVEEAANGEQGYEKG